jgi:3'-phosphoadenosine 5'-phosphosulfate sulfotransferase (PAPS reductase)/FAD synthetase
LTPKFQCLLSGGKDSVCTAHVLAKRGELGGCVFVDTGIACPDTRPFVERLCQEQGWPLLVTTPDRTYQSAVLQYGFPKDLKGHSWAFGILKERAMRTALAQLGPSTVFASGARAAESDRRAKNTARGFRHNGHLRIVNPIEDWSNLQVWNYIRENGLSVSPAYLTLGRSGDCLCGAFSQKGEADVIRRAYPEVAERIRQLEAKVTETINPKTGRPFRYPKNRWGGSRSKGGFEALRGRQSLEALVCGGDCQLPENEVGLG